MTTADHCRHGVSQRNGGWSLDSASGVWIHAHPDCNRPSRATLERLNGSQTTLESATMVVEVESASDQIEVSRGVQMKTFADAEVRLAEVLPRYESRPQQQEMARAVEAVFANADNFVLAHPDRPEVTRRHLIAQAGCGVGKSLGYLIPAILAGRRTIVSVTTKALQDQLATKDLPFLQESLGVNFSWCVLKGRGNYFCENKAADADESDVPMLAAAMHEADAPDFGGTREDFTMEFTPAQWGMLNADADECQANDCKDKGGCYAEAARARAKECAVVVVNHALFFTDLMVKSLFEGSVGMLGEYELVVFDEALALDTPVPTPTGWTTVGEISVGDEVLGGDGLPVEVVRLTEINNQADCYRVTLQDGTSVVADGGHLWVAAPKMANSTQYRTPRVVTTRDLLDGKWRIPAHSPVELPEADFPLDPYLLGFWLGNGHLGQPHMTVRPDTYQEFSFQADLGGHPSKVLDSENNKMRVSLSPEPQVFQSGFGRALTDLGVYRDKHVPAMYLRGSIAQRLSLIQGLMDSDGYVNGENSYCTFSNTNERIIDSMVEVLRSLGIVATKCPTTDVREGTRGVHAPCWKVHFSGSAHLMPFRIRDTESIKVASAQGRSGNRRVMSVEPVDSTPVRCIEVSNADHTFLAGDGWTLTHNCHEAADIAGDMLGGRFSAGSVASLSNAVRSWAAKFAADGDEAFLTPIANLSMATTALFAALPSAGDGRNPRLAPEDLDKIANELGVVEAGIRALGGVLKAAKIHPQANYDQAKKRKDRLRRQGNGTHARLIEIITADFAEIVRWVEVEKKMYRGKWTENKVIKVAPVDVSPILREWLFTKTPTIMTSATLAVKGTMAFAASRLGVDNYDEVDVGSPFDFGAQSRLYVPVDLPEPKGVNLPMWEAMAVEEIVRLVTISKGRALVLFTNIKQMQAAHKAVAARIPYVTKMQGGGETVKDLAAWFTTETSGVLFGTKSFMTGFDVQGESLSLVVIVKMPFPVPTEPLTAARCEAIEAKGGNAFSDYTIPVMSLILQQALGRLIRHTSDKGLVAILDPRILSKGYGKSILRDLPPMPVVTKMEDVSEFFAEVDAHYATLA